MNERGELIDLLWKKAEPMAFIPKEQFVEAMNDWHIYPVVEKNTLIAIVGENGPHIHFEVTGTGKPIPRRIVAKVLQGIIDKHGYAVTKTPKEETRQRKFNELIGFKMVGEDEYDILYKIEQVRRGRVS